LPPLHDAGAFGSTRPDDEPPFGRSFAAYHDGGARTWAPWYRDWMTGRLRPADSARLAAFDPGGDAGPVTQQSSLIGLTPERWALRDRPA
jgi:hypothetical protein